MRWVGGVLLCLVIGLAILMSAGSAAIAADAWDCATVDAPGTATPVRVFSGTPVPIPEDGGGLTIFAAASLTDPFNEIKDSLEAEYPELTITMSFAGSQTLVTQVAEGAPADVLAVAATEPMDRALEEGVVESSPFIFARNELTVIVPNDNPAGIESAADLGEDDLRLVIAAPEVPAGAYARQSICLMAAETGTYGQGFVERVAANVVSEENNVKSVLAKVALGEAGAGIVYTSDVTDDVVAVTIPDEVNVVASYPIAPVIGGNEELARAFISYV